MYMYTLIDWVLASFVVINFIFVQSSFSSRFGHFFDLTSSMDSVRLEAVEKTCFSAGDVPTRFEFHRRCLRLI